MEMTHEEIFHSMTEMEVRYSLDAYQEANKRLQISLDNAEKSMKRLYTRSQILEKIIGKLRADLVAVKETIEA